MELVRIFNKKRIVVMPHLLYKLGIDMLSYISVPKLMAFMLFWIEGKMFYNLMADIIIIAVGIIAYIYTSYRLVKH